MIAPHLGLCIGFRAGGTFAANSDSPQTHVKRWSWEILRITPAACASCRGRSSRWVAAISRLTVPPEDSIRLNRGFIP